MDSDFGEFGVFFFKALKSYSQCYRKKVTHAGDQRSVSPNFVCNMGRCWRFFARSTRFDLKAPPEADALKMWKNRALLCVSQNEEQESRYIKIRKKKLQHVFHPGASLILADLVAAMARFEDLVSVPRRWPFSSAKKAAGSSGHRSLQILQGVPEIMALTKKSLKSCRQGVSWNEISKSCIKVTSSRIPSKPTGFHQGVVFHAPRLGGFLAWIATNCSEVHSGRWREREWEYQEAHQPVFLILMYVSFFRFGCFDVLPGFLMGLAMQYQCFIIRKVGSLDDYRASLVFHVYFRCHFCVQSWENPSQPFHSVPWMAKMGCFERICDFFPGHFL